MEENRNESALKIKLVLALLIHLSIIAIVVGVCGGAGYIHPLLGFIVAYTWGANKGSDAFKSVTKIPVMLGLIFSKW